MQRGPKSEDDFAISVPIDAPIVPELHSVCVRDVVEQHVGQLGEDPPPKFLHP